MKIVLAAVLGILLFPAQAEARDTVVICHATGSGSYVTLKLPVKAVFGKAGHFYENGTPTAGHEDDYLGPCIPTETTTTTTQPPTTTTSTSTTTSSSTTSSTTTTSSVPVVTSTSVPRTRTSVDITTSVPVTDPTTTSSVVTTVPVSSSTSTSIAIDTCEDLGSCPTTTPGPSTTTTTVVTSSTHPPTGAGLTAGMSGIAALLIGLGALALRLARA